MKFYLNEGILKESIYSKDSSQPKLIKIYKRKLDMHSPGIK